MIDFYVKYHAPIEPIERFKIGDWVDLRCARRVDLKAGDFCPISLGVTFMLPAGYEAIVAARSSLFANHGVIPTGGIYVIDNSFCGENDIVKFPVYATRDTRIDFNERICQFRLFKNQEPIHAIPVDATNHPDRGGLGSTGKF